MIGNEEGKISSYVHLFRKLIDEFKENLVVVLEFLCPTNNNGHTETGPRFNANPIDMRNSTTPVHCLVYMFIFPRLFSIYSYSM